MLDAPLNTESSLLFERALRTSLEKLEGFRNEPNGDIRRIVMVNNMSNYICRVLDRIISKEDPMYIPQRLAAPPLESLMKEMNEDTLRKVNRTIGQRTLDQPSPIRVENIYDDAKRQNIRLEPKLGTFATDLFGRSPYSNYTALAKGLIFGEDFSPKAFEIKPEPEVSKRSSFFDRFKRSKKPLVQLEIQVADSNKHSKSKTEQISPKDLLEIPLKRNPKHRSSVTPITITNTAVPVELPDDKVAPSTRMLSRKFDDTKIMEDSKRNRPDIDQLKKAYLLLDTVDMYIESLPPKQEFGNRRRLSSDFWQVSSDSNSFKRLLEMRQKVRSGDSETMEPQMSSKEFLEYVKSKPRTVRDPSFISEPEQVIEEKKADEDDAPKSREEKRRAWYQKQADIQKTKYAQPADDHRRSIDTALSFQERRKLRQKAQSPQPLPYPDNRVDSVISSEVLDKPFQQPSSQEQEQEQVNEPLQMTQSEQILVSEKQSSRFLFQNPPMLNQNQINQPSKGAKIRRDSRPIVEEGPFSAIINPTEPEPTEDRHAAVINATYSNSLPNDDRYAAKVEPVYPKPPPKEDRYAAIINPVQSQPTTKEDRYAAIINPTPPKKQDRYSTTIYAESKSFNNSTTIHATETKHPTNTNNTNNTNNSFTSTQTLKYREWNQPINDMKAPTSPPPNIQYSEIPQSRPLFTKPTKGILKKVSKYAEKA